MLSVEQTEQLGRVRQRFIIPKMLSRLSHRMYNYAVVWPFLRICRILITDIITSLRIRMVQVQVANSGRPYSTGTVVVHTAECNIRYNYCTEYLLYEYFTSIINGFKNTLLYYCIKSSM